MSPRLSGWRNRLRLIFGLTLLAFVTGHFLNISMGIVSIDLMTRGAKILLAPWHTIFGMVLLAVAFLGHLLISLWSIWDRRTLRMSAREAAQLISGLLAPVLLVGHVIGTYVSSVSTSFEPSFYTVLAEYWVISPWRGGVQVAAMLMVWAHGCLGLYFWLNRTRGYARYHGVALSVVIVIPALALAGFVSAGNLVLNLAKEEGWIENLFATANGNADFFATRTLQEQVFLFIFFVVLGTMLIARHIRNRMQGSRRPHRLYYRPGNLKRELIPGATLLESIRAAEIPHASICGGRGRCSTCRVRVTSPLEGLPSPNDLEVKALSRHTNSPSIRLACQLRPITDIEVTALMHPDTSSQQNLRQPNFARAGELDVSFLFVDLRGSTGLSQDRMPFDIAYILDLFFTEMHEALRSTNGHYAQFTGDGLLAIYGLDSGPQAGCIEAIKGAREMFSRMEDLNVRLKNELPDGLRIGIGIHSGEAIVGAFGPPSSSIISAVGHNVNVAARLEALTKDLAAPLIISSVVATRGNLNVDRRSFRSVKLKGMTNEFGVYAIDDLAMLSDAMIEFVA